MKDTYNIPVRGQVAIRVVKDGKVVAERVNPNVVIVDLLRIIMAQLIPKNTSTTNAITAAGRPNINVNQITGPDNSNTIAYMKIGYTQDSSISTGVTSKLDTNINSPTFETLKIYKCVPTSASISLYASKSITAEDTTKFYYEAGLFCPNTVNSAVPDSPNNSALILVAHQIFDFVQAPQNSTVEFEWTLIFQE